MSHDVQVRASGKTFTVEQHETILDGALEAGVPIPYECMCGTCGTCRIHVIEGEVEYIVPPSALSSAEIWAGYALACQATASTDLVLRDCGEPPVVPGLGAAVVARELVVTLTKRTWLTQDIASITLHAGEDVDIAYLPGQHLNVRCPDTDDRSYSIVSAYPIGNDVELHIKNLPGGACSENYLCKLPVGSAVTIEVPRGSFYLRAYDDAAAGLHFVANGTGIAPIHAMLESLLDKSDAPPITLYWGMRHETDLYLLDEFEHIRSRLSSCTIIPVLSQPDAGWHGARGYVQNALDERALRMDGAVTYICGSPDMIRDVKDVVIEKGVQPGAVYAEGFAAR